MKDKGIKKVFHPFRTGIDRHMAGLRRRWLRLAAMIKKEKTDNPPPLYCKTATALRKGDYSSSSPPVFSGSFPMRFKNSSRQS